MGRPVVIEGCGIAHLNTSNNCIRETPVIITNGAPLVAVIHLQPPLAGSIGEANKTKGQVLERQKETREREQREKEREERERERARDLERGEAEKENWESRMLVRR